MNLIVYADISKPDGETMKLQLFDSGLGFDNKKDDGIYTNHLSFKKAGLYNFKVIAKGAILERQKKVFYNVADPTKKKGVSPTSIKSQESSEQKPVNTYKNNTFSLKAAILKFVLINLVIGVLIFAYIKRRSLFRQKGN